MIVITIMLSGLVFACVDTANKAEKAMAEEEIAFEELAVSIEQYNEYFYKNFGIDPETRARKKRDWGMIVGADVTGAIMGSFFWIFSLIAAVSASVGTAIATGSSAPDSAPTINSLTYYSKINSY